jgi:hypothetical protein
MKRMKFFVLAPVLTVTALVFGGCGDGLGGNTMREDEKGGKTPNNTIELTANVWSDGAVTDGGEQWFKFIARGAVQYLHIIYGTMNNMDVQLYTNSGNALGNAINLHSNQANYTSFSVSSGQVYYVKVTPGTGYQYESSKTGTYRITFNSVQFTPGTFDAAASLSEGVWANGNILDGGEQWFKFTASAGTQYLHVIFGTMDNMDVRLYTDTADALGNALHLRGGGDSYTSLIITSGQVYYVRVTPGTDYQYISSKTGTYRIAFNASETAPAAN